MRGRFGNGFTIYHGMSPLNSRTELLREYRLCYCVPFSLFFVHIPLPLQFSLSLSPGSLPAHSTERMHRVKPCARLIRGHHRYLGLPRKSEPKSLFERTLCRFVACSLCNQWQTRGKGLSTFDHVPSEDSIDQRIAISCSVTRLFEFGD